MSDDFVVVIIEDVLDLNKDNLVVRVCGVEKVLIILNVCLVVGVEVEVEVVIICDEDRFIEENIDVIEVLVMFFVWDWFMVVVDVKVIVIVFDRYGWVRGVIIVEEILIIGFDEDGLIGLVFIEE